MNLTKKKKIHKFFDKYKKNLAHKKKKFYSKSFVFFLIILFLKKKISLKTNNFFINFQIFPFKNKITKILPFIFFYIRRNKAG